MEDLLAKSSEASTAQRRQLALLQFENKRLGLHVMDLRQQVPSERYIHVKHDAIDRQLAKYLNGKNIACLHMPRDTFKRESEGVYLFGDQKITLKMSAVDRKLLVRSSGVYQFLDDFVRGHAEQFYQNTLSESKQEPLIVDAVDGRTRLNVDLTVIENQSADAGSQATVWNEYTSPAHEVLTDGLDDQSSSPAKSTQMLRHRYDPVAPHSMQHSAGGAIASTVQSPSGSLVIDSIDLDFDASQEQSPQTSSMERDQSSPRSTSRSAEDDCVGLEESYGPNTGL